MKCLKLKKDISYVVEGNAAIILNFTDGVFLKLDGLYARVIDCIGNNCVEENEIKSKIICSKDGEFNTIIGELVKNNIIIEVRSSNNEK